MYGKLWSTCSQVVVSFCWVSVYISNLLFPLIGALLPSSSKKKPCTSTIKVLAILLASKLYPVFHFFSSLGL